MQAKLTLRDLFWLTLVCGLALGWWISSRNERLQDKTAIELLRVAGDDIDLWQYRAEELAKRVREDGWEVTWSGDWNLHEFDVISPAEKQAAMPSLTPSLP